MFVSDLTTIEIPVSLKSVTYEGILILVIYAKLCFYEVS
jgi:hypothetical protein